MRAKVAPARSSKKPGTVMARLLSVNVGLPNDIAWHGKTVHTAVWKRAVSGRRMARRLNLDGDGQGDLIGHGGEHRAVFVYQFDCYRYWQRELGRDDFSFGQFGENFTVEGLPDDKVCIGDRYRIGSALFEVTQPRVTCYRVGIRMNEPTMAALLVSHGRPGFYFRVLEEGEVKAGEEIIMVASGAEQMTVAQANALLYLPGHSREELERALRIPALSAGWKNSFQALLQQKLRAGPASGNPGLAPSEISLAPPAWRGFRPMRVTAKARESVDVISFVFEPADALRLATPLPGQFIVLRLQPKREAPPLMRSYSLSGAPNTEQYRVSIKCEIAGAASTYLDGEIGIGNMLRAPARAGERRHRHYSGAGDTARAGRQVFNTRNLVAIRSPQRQASPVCRRIARPAAPAAPCPQPNLVQQTDARGSTRHGFRCPWASGGRVLRRTECSAPSRFLSMRSNSIHVLREHGSCSLERSTRAHIYRSVRLCRIQHARHRQFPSSPPALAQRGHGDRATRFVCAQQSLDSLGSEVPKPAGACRSLRCSREMVVPHRGVPPLRERTRGRSGRLPARSARIPCRE